MLLRQLPAGDQHQGRDGDPADHHYGRFYRSRCVQVLRHFNEALGKWAQRKYTRFRRRERAAMHWLGRIARRDPDLFVLWRQGVRPEAGV